jgi:hypothetical protein
MFGEQLQMRACCSQKVLCRPLPRMLLALSNTEAPSHLHTRCGPPVAITISKVGSIYLCWYIRSSNTRIFLIVDVRLKKIKHHLKPHTNDRRYGLSKPARREGITFQRLPFHRDEADSSLEPFFCLASRERCHIRRQTSA